MTDKTESPASPTSEKQDDVMLSAIRASFQQMADDCAATASSIEFRNAVGLLGDETAVAAHYRRNQRFYQARADVLKAIERENTELRAALTESRRDMASAVAALDSREHSSARLAASLAQKDEEIAECSDLLAAARDEIRRLITIAELVADGHDSAVCICVACMWRRERDGAQS